MEKRQTDLLIIGAGPGGYVAAIYARKQGLNVILVDKEWIGGTCLNVGCIPIKALVKSAGIYAGLKDNQYGVHTTDASINLSEVISHKDEITGQLVSGIAYLLDKHGVDYIEGSASFLNDHEVKVNETIIKASSIIIATGSTPKHLPIEGQSLSIDSRQLLKLTDMPKSMTIIGGGVIGMEFAFIYAQMGVSVSMVEFLPSILPGIDKELSKRLVPYAKKAGIKILTNAQVVKIEETDDFQKKVTYLRKEKEASLKSDIVLEAVGRGPLVKGLSLENTSLNYDQKNGIVVDARMKTNLGHIYAIGDVNNIMQLAHVASHQAMVAVDNILKRPRTFNKANVPSVIFTSPQIATVGITEEMAKEKNMNVDIIKTPFSANGKSMISGGQRGYMKLIRDHSSKAIIGGMVIGQDAEHLIATLTLAIQQGLKASDVYHTIFAHPTTQELVHEAALGLDGLAIHYLD